MSGRLALLQINQLKALANCGYGEVFSKVVDPKGVRRRARYSFTVTCSRCGGSYRASWSADALLLLTRHLHHRTDVRIIRAKDPEAMPTRNAARIDMQKDLIDQVLAACGEATTSELADATGLHIRTVSRRLHEMLLDGEVNQVRRGAWSPPGG